MESFFIIGIPALTAWGISVGYRCTSEHARRLLRPVLFVMVIWLIAGIAFGDPFLIAAFATDAILFVVIEGLLVFNVVPSVRRVRQVFQRLPLDLRIISAGGKQIYQTDAASEIDDAALRAFDATMQSAQRDEVVTLRSPSMSNVVYRRYRLQAGTAVLAEQTTEISELQKRLERKRDHLLRQNEILRQQHEMQSLLYRQQREHELCERVELDLEAAMIEIRSLLSDLASNDALSDKKRLQRLNLVKTLVAYCKRKGMLALASAESDTIARSQVELVARETMADLRALGIECGTLIETGATVPIAAINDAYDGFYICTFCLQECENPVMMAYLSQTADYPVVMSVSIECEPPHADAQGLESIANAIDRRLARQRGIHSVTLDEGVIAVKVYGRSDLP